MVFFFENHTGLHWRILNGSMVCWWIPLSQVCLKEERDRGEESEGREGRGKGRHVREARQKKEVTFNHLSNFTISFHLFLFPFAFQ